MSDKFPMGHQVWADRPRPGSNTGVDYNEVFTPTFRPAALQLILAIAVIENMELHSVDHCNTLQA